MSISSVEIELPSAALWMRRRDMREQAKRVFVLESDLIASRARERTLQRQALALSQHHDTLAQEFEHRLINGLQLVVSLLSLQSRAATTPEAAAQLKTAAERVAAIGRVHSRLHRLDDQKQVEFKQYLQNLCGDLADLLFHHEADAGISVDAAPGDLPTALAIPLGFIVSELVTNSVKYAPGNVAVRFESQPFANHVLSVRDQGPGLPADFAPCKSKGLGMKIVLSLVKEIGGRLDILPGDNDKGACFQISFRSAR